MKKDVSVIWVLDKETNERLNELKKVVEKFDIDFQPTYAHITIASFINIDVDEILQYTKDFFKDKRSFSFNCSVLGLLTTNCIACIPSISREMFGVFKEYHKEFDSYCNEWTSYKRGLWLPHTSIYYSEIEDLSIIFAEMYKEFVQFSGKVVSVELSIVKEDGFDIIYSHKLM